jgi:ribonuclease E
VEAHASVPNVAAIKVEEPLTVEPPRAAVTEESIPVTPLRRRHEVGSSEPRIERVVVRPGEESEGSVAEAQAVPQRKGWWQRKFSGE